MWKKMSWKLRNQWLELSKQSVLDCIEADQLLIATGAQ